MKRFLIALSLLAIAGCGSGEDDEATPTPSSEDGDAPATTSRRPAAPQGMPPQGMPPQGMPMGGPGGQGGGQSTVALPPMAAANKAPEPPSATGSLQPAPPVNFDTDKFIAQGAKPKTVRSAKAGQVVATPGPAGASPSMPMGASSQMRPPGMPPGMVPGR